MEYSEGTGLMSPSEELRPFLKPLAALQRVISQSNCPGLLIGGIATSLLGAPRLTVDIDTMIILPDEHLSDFIEAALKEGFICRISQAENFARKNRVLLLRHQESGINVDVTIGLLPFEIEAIERSSELKVEGIPVRLPSPEDLVILKAVAHRPKDLVDIQAVIELYPDLDRDRIENWVKQFARLLEMPELWDDISKFFKE